MANISAEISGEYEFLKIFNFFTNKKITGISASVASADGNLRGKYIDKKWWCVGAEQPKKNWKTFAVFVLAGLEN